MLTSAIAAMTIASTAPSLIVDIGPQQRGAQTGAAVGGHLLLPVGGLQLDLANHEGLDPGGSIGAIFVGARGALSPTSFWRAGFAHHHGVTWPTLQAEPFGAIAGTSDGIDHRTGFGIGAGWRGSLHARPLLPKLLRNRSHWIADLGLDATVVDNGWNWVGALRVGLEFALKGG